MATTKVFFRADASAEIGYGHLMRSLAVARMLSNHFSCSFLTKNITPKGKDIILSVCDKIVDIPGSVTSDQEVLFFSSYLTHAKIVVLDGYHFDTEYQNKIKGLGCIVVCIDDIHKYHFVADAVINHAGGVDKKNYSIDPLTELYLGPRYALVDQKFLSDMPLKKSDQVLICLGGADKSNYTQSVVAQLLNKKVSKKIIVVIGEAYSHRNSLEELLTNSPVEALVYQAVSPDTLAELMRSAAVAVCSASTVAYEYLGTKGELYLLQTADNQKHIYQYLIENKLAWDFNDFGRVDRKQVLTSILNQNKAFDGQSAKRIVEIFTGLVFERELVIRKAKAVDAQIYFEWANDGDVRKNAFTKNEITWEDHVRWFGQKVQSTESRLYIFTHKDISIGQVRFDFHDHAAYIDYSVAKESRGQNHGFRILKLAIRELRKEFPLITVVGEVIEGNVSSTKTFERLNFRYGRQVTKMGHRTNVYEQGLS
jgi:UDP-2,4-diacetamido-2,4,6-trideoxy-beta-L-altropyranose hydrolase